MIDAERGLKAVLGVLGGTYIDSARVTDQRIQWRIGGVLEVRREGPDRVQGREVEEHRHDVSIARLLNESADGFVRGAHVAAREDNVVARILLGDVFRGRVAQARVATSDDEASLH